MAKENKPAESVKKKVGNAYVTTPFRDKDNFDVAYDLDQDVSEHVRLDELIAAGVVEVHAEPVADGKPA